MNVELQQLYEADQTDRLNLPPPGILAARDRARRERVGPLLTSISSPDGDDFFHAGMIFQHGEQVEDYWRAHELALRAAELGHGTGRWLAAATYDRWLMQQGKPQKYGTQYRFDGERMTLWKVDPATTDHERAEWSVPSLAEARARAERLPFPQHKALAPAERRRAGSMDLAYRSGRAGASATTHRADQFRAARTPGHVGLAAPGQGTGLRAIDDRGPRGSPDLRVC